MSRKGFTKIMTLFVTIAALRRLHSATQRQLAAVTGKDQSTISRNLRQIKVAESLKRNEHNQPVKVYELAARK